MTGVSKARSAVCLFALCISMLAGCAPKRNFAGVWNGTVSFKNPTSGTSISLPLAFHIVKKDDGTYSGTFDSKAQGANGLPLAAFAVDGDKVTLSIALGAVKASYAGTSNPDGTEIKGNLTQGSNTLPLDLKKEPDAK